MKRCYAEADLMKGLRHIVLWVLVHLTDTVPKHNGPNTTLKTFYVRIRSLKTTCLPGRSSCDHDNIKTVLLLRHTILITRYIPTLLNIKVLHDAIRRTLLSEHTEKYGFKMVYFGVQQLVAGAVPLKGHICTFLPIISTSRVRITTPKVLICNYYW